MPFPYSHIKLYNRCSAEKAAGPSRSPYYLSPNILRLHHSSHKPNKSGQAFLLKGKPHLLQGLQCSLYCSKCAWSNVTLLSAPDHRHRQSHTTTKSPERKCYYFHISCFRAGRIPCSIRLSIRQKFHHKFLYWQIQTKPHLSADSYSLLSKI